MTQINPQSFQPSLTNLQVELLKLFAMQLPEEHLKDVRLMIARYLMDKARDRADKIWEEKGYDENTLKQLINGDI